MRTNSVVHNAGALLIFRVPFRGNFLVLLFRKVDFNQLLGQAAKTYADTKREAARTGWWQQLPNGRWVQK